MIIVGTTGATSDDENEKMNPDEEESKVFPAETVSPK